MNSLVFGITGSIACGKSTVTKFMRKAGIPIVDADVVAREVVVPGSFGLRQVINEFGSEYLLPDGNLDRPKLGQLVFNNKAELSKLNRIMFPLIHEETECQFIKLKRDDHSIIGYDSALVIENGFADDFRPLVVVVADESLQLKRLMARNGLTEADARARMDKQLSSKDKAKYADFLIETNGTLDELESKTLSVLSDIKAAAKRADEVNQRTAS